MTMGPAPMIMIDLISVLFGMAGVLLTEITAWQSESGAGSAQIVLRYRQRDERCKGDRRCGANCRFRAFRVAAKPLYAGARETLTAHGDPDGANPL